MKNMIKYIVVLFAWLLTGCYEEDKIHVGEENEPFYTLPQGNHDYDQDIVSWFDRCGFYILYDFDEKDLYWNNEEWKQSGMLDYGLTGKLFGKKADPEYAGEFSVDDFAAAFIRMEDGLILDFRIAWAMNMDTPGDTILLGTKGGLRIPSTECWNGSMSGPMTLYHEVAGQSVETTLPILPNDFSELFYRKIRSFLDAVETGGKAPVSSSEILINQAIIDGIVRSANAGHEVTVEIPEI